MFYRPPHAHHNRGGGGQAECARAGNHQYGHGVYQRGNPVAFQQPSKNKSEHGDGDYGGHKHRGGLVGHPRNRRFAALCFGQRGHHIAEQGVAAELFGAVHNAAVGHQRARQYLAVFGFGFRLGFAGEVALIRPTAAAHHHTVGSNALAVVGAD